MSSLIKNMPIQEYIPAPTASSTPRVKPDLYVKITDSFLKEYIAIYGKTFNVIRIV